MKRLPLLRVYIVTKSGFTVKLYIGKGKFLKLGLKLSRDVFFSPSGGSIVTLQPTVLCEVVCQTRNTKMSCFVKWI